MLRQQSVFSWHLLIVTGFPQILWIKSESESFDLFQRMTTNAIVKKKKIVADFLLIMRQKSKLLSGFIKGSSIICVSMKEYAIAVIWELSSRLNNNKFDLTLLAISRQISFKNHRHPTIFCINTTKVQKIK